MMSHESMYTINVNDKPVKHDVRSQNEIMVGNWSEQQIRKWRGADFCHVFKQINCAMVSKLWQKHTE